MVIFSIVEEYYLLSSVCYGGGNIQYCGGILSSVYYGGGNIQYIEGILSTVCYGGEYSVQWGYDQYGVRVSSEGQRISRKISTRGDTTITVKGYHKYNYCGGISVVR